MYRSHNNGALRMKHVGQEICLSGWVQKVRDKGFMVWVDLRDRYGITQLIFDAERTDADMVEQARSLGREFVIQIKGIVIEREAKNDKMPTGDIEILVSELSILNKSKTPPFTIEDETDGGEELRMKYRYLDIRRNPVGSAPAQTGAVPPILPESLQWAYRLPILPSNHLLYPYRRIYLHPFFH